MHQNAQIQKSKLYKNKTPKTSTESTTHHFLQPNRSLLVEFRFLLVSRPLFLLLQLLPSSPSSSPFSSSSSPYLPQFIPNNSHYSSFGSSSFLSSFSTPITSFSYILVLSFFSISSLNLIQYNLTLMSCIISSLVSYLKTIKSLINFNSIPHA